MANPNVFQALMQPLRSVADYSNEYENAQALRNRNALQALTLQQQADQTQQGQIERNALRRAAESAGGDRNKFVSLLRSSGLPGLLTQANSLEQSGAKLMESQATAREKNSTADKNDYTVKMQKSDKAIADIANLADPQAALASLQAHRAAGDIDDLKYQSVLSTLQPSLQNPAQFGQWKRQMVIGIMDAKDRLAATAQKVTMVNAGGQLVPVNENADAGPVGQIAGVAPVKVTQSPDNAATVGASLANAAALREQAKATRDAANTQRDQATEMKLADDYRAQSKEFQQAKSAHEQLSATLGSATTSPAATLAAATKFMKILDPGSVVRESELGMALAASGVIDRAMNYISTLQSGKKLTPTQVADFRKISDQMYEAAKRVQQSIDKDYQAKAKTYNLRPEMVTQDLGQNQAAGLPDEIAAILAKHGGKK